MSLTTETIERNKIAMMTVDVEQPELDVHTGVNRFLSLFDEFNVHATFFITYNVAKRMPAIVEKITKAGHEVASHGYSHPLPNQPHLTAFTESEILREVEESKKFLLPFGIEPQGIRLPAFKINRKILETVSGYFLYDSSIIPVFGFNRNMSELMEFCSNRQNFFEIPVSGIKKLNIRLGSPAFFSLGIDKMVTIMQLFGVTKPIVFYAHSFDLTNVNTSLLVTKRWKKKWYYEKCDSEKIDFFRDFLSYLKSEKYKIMRCVDYAHILKGI